MKKVIINLEIPSYNHLLFPQCAVPFILNNQPALLF